MAGTQTIINVSDLDDAILKGWLYFIRSVFRRIGITMEVYKDDLEFGKDNLLLCVDGPLEAFTHRLKYLVSYGSSFAGAIAEMTGGKGVGHLEQVFLRILKECQEHVNDHAKMTEMMRAKYGEVEIFVASLPQKLNMVSNKPDCPEYLATSIEDLNIAIQLLHDVPFDPTLSLIAADRAVEIYLKGALNVSRDKFPNLLKKARSQNILNEDQLSSLYEAHKIRNKCQHDGLDVDFYDAVKHVKDVIEILETIIC